MAFAKFQENRFRIDGEIAENHLIKFDGEYTYIWGFYAPLLQSDLTLNSLTL